MTSFDTSVAVAALQRNHTKHETCSEILQRFLRSREACWSQHFVAELHSALTGTPGPDRLPPRRAIDTITDLCGMARVVELDLQDYFAAQERVAAIGIPGGRIFDALHVISAEKVGAKQLYTLNPKHFRPLSRSVEVLGL